MGATRTIEPMRSCDFSAHGGEIDWGTAYAQPLVGGLRALAVKGGDAALLYGPEGGHHRPAPGVDEELAVALPEGVTVDGVLLYANPGGPVSRRPDVRYHVYDLVSDAPFRQRYERLQSLFSDHDRVRPVQTVIARNKHDLAFLQAYFLERGFDGAVLRHTRLGYEPGVRSKSLLKVEAFASEDFEVVDVKRPVLLRGPAGAFVCQTAAGTLFEVPALRPAVRRRLDGGDYLRCVGKRLTVKFYEYVAPGPGRTREGRVPSFPVAIGFRD